MNTLEPLCNLEQSEMLKVLGFREEVNNYFQRYTPTEEYYDRLKTFYRDANNESYFECSRPTISLAKNWLYEEYGLWINTIYVKGEKVMSYTSFVEFGSIKIKNTTYSDNPHTAESDCLTEVLKKLISEQQVLRD